MKFIKVLNTIVKITNNCVVFNNPIMAKKLKAKSVETYINRIFKKKILWKLMNDGIYVHSDYVKSYELLTM